MIFHEADCDTDHYLVAAKSWERLAVRKQTAHKFDVEIFNLRNLNDLEDRKEYPIVMYATFRNCLTFCKNWNTIVTNFLLM